LSESTTAGLPEGRLVSLDVFRGFTMFVLIAESALVYEALMTAAAPGSLLEAVALQFHHHPWNGLRFWDLVQPFFMFIVGVAMAFSVTRRWGAGDTWGETFHHVAVRCLILLCFGVSLHIGYAEALVWELWNVLSQLSVTIMVAFVIFKLPWRTQLAISFGLLLLSEILYRSFPLDGFDQPFVQGENFGAWMDTVLMGKINPSGWVAINVLPTSAQTIWGVLAGKLLMSDRAGSEKLKYLLIGGLIGLVVGYGLDVADVTPIIKRICTSSFVIVSGGWCLLTLALFYWLMDLKGSRWGTKLFIVVGMNPIFIYMFAETLGEQWFNAFVAVFTHGILGWFGAGATTMEVLTSVIVLSSMTYLCYWLYNRRIFIRI
jgi:predicted acyltransferase